jgi:transcriptional regulator with XRE-family HTH domain
MNLQAVGKLVAQRRREKGLTLSGLAEMAQIGRSTLAAVESGKLPELGYEKVNRICSALDMVLEPRLLALDTPLIEHRHLTDTAGRDLTKAAIEDIIVRGDLRAWRGLIKAVQEDSTRKIEGRVKQVVSGSDKSDPKVQAFRKLLPGILKRRDDSRP